MGKEIEDHLKRCDQCHKLKQKDLVVVRAQNWCAADKDKFPMRVCIDCSLSEQVVVTDEERARVNKYLWRKYKSEIKKRKEREKQNG